MQVSQLRLRGHCPDTYRPPPDTNVLSSRALGTLCDTLGVQETDTVGSMVGVGPLR